MDAQVPPNLLPIQYVQQYMYLGAGSFSFITSLFACSVIGFSAQLRKSQPFFLALAIGDLITASCYVVMAIIRTLMLNSNTLYNLIKPSECLKMPFIYLFIFGTEYSVLIGFFMAVDRLIIVAYPDWYKANWTYNVSKILISFSVAYGIFAVAFAILAILQFGADGNFTKRQCGLVTMLGPLFGPYHYVMCVVVSTVATVICICAFFLTKSKISEMRVKGQSFSAVLKDLKIQLQQSVTTLMLSLVAYLLAISTNVSYMNLSLGFPTFNFDSLSGKIATIAYCCSCGLTIFILIASDSEVRRQVVKFLLWCRKQQPEISTKNKVKSISLQQQISTDTVKLS